MKRTLKILIACEESQRICTEFRKRGHEAYSCDVQEPSGGHPEWHILGDVLPILNPDKESGCIEFDTMGGATPHCQQVGFDRCASAVYLLDYGCYTASQLEMHAA